MIRPANSAIQRRASGDKQLVGNKYIISLCGAGAGGTLRAAAALAYKPLDSCGPCATLVSTLVQVGMTALLNSAFLLPLNYRSYEKGKICVLSYGRPGCLMGFGVSANEDSSWPGTFCRRAFRHWLCWALY